MLKATLLRSGLKLAIVASLLFMFLKPMPFTPENQPEDVLVPVGDPSLLVDNPLFDSVKRSINKAKEWTNWLSIIRISNQEEEEEILTERLNHQNSSNCKRMTPGKITEENLLHCFGKEMVAKRLESGCSSYKKVFQDVEAIETDVPLAFMHDLDNSGPKTMAEFEFAMAMVQRSLRHYHCIITEDLDVRSLEQVFTILDCYNTTASIYQGQNTSHLTFYDKAVSRRNPEFYCYDKLLDVNPKWNFMIAPKPVEGTKGKLRGRIDDIAKLETEFHSMKLAHFNKIVRSEYDTIFTFRESFHFQYHDSKIAMEMEKLTNDPFRSIIFSRNLIERVVVDVLKSTTLELITQSNQTALHRLSRRRFSLVPFIEADEIRDDLQIRNLLLSLQKKPIK